ncbi:MAG: hypothetical protein H0U59_07650 [Gemmatimonadaceae bacterium]|nr:hypothetical protein [Gemmatimonadaceae bacterium]
MKELVVVDRNGVDRIRIAGELPDAIIKGRRVPKGERAAGVILYDSTGQERSGYVTWEPSGNVGMAVDTKSSNDRHSAGTVGTLQGVKLEYPSQQDCPALLGFP